MDSSIVDRIAKAIDNTRFGEVILVIQEGRVTRIDTHMRLIAWSPQNPLDVRVEKGHTVD